MIKSLSNSPLPRDESPPLPLQPTLLPDQPDYGKAESTGLPMRFHCRPVIHPGHLRAQPNPLPSGTNYYGQAEALSYGRSHRRPVLQPGLYKRIQAFFRTGTFRARLKALAYKMTPSGGRCNQVLLEGELLVGGINHRPTGRSHAKGSDRNVTVLRVSSKSKSGSNQDVTRDPIAIEDVASLDRRPGTVLLEWRRNKVKYLLFPVIQ